jgi:lysylphosphatidylglycerol synthetase-like protein (DUF2156 family)
MATRPVRAATWLFHLNGGLWLALAGMTLLRSVGGSSERAMGTRIAAILMVGNAMAMWTAGWGVGRRLRLAWVFGVTVLLVNIVLTFTDQVGWVDWATCTVDVILLAVMLAARREVWREAPG